MTENTVSPEESTEITETIYEKRTSYATPQEFAANCFNRGEFVVLVWDWDKYRLGQRIKEMMSLGYKPISGSFISHTVYNDQNGHKLPVKQDLCILMTHEGLYTHTMGV
jgi:hypothetical protein